ncbi:hypothetical protein J3R03_003233 [Actinoplanes couchii]|nr:hypothetical protein [Actinoplanes couchii]
MAYGTHTVRLRVTGTGTVLSVDRAGVWTN